MVERKFANKSMGKMIKASLIKSAADLVTPRNKTRAGFIAIALEKKCLAVPYVEEAKTLKIIASRVKEPKDLLQVEDLRAGLLTASGRSIKPLNHMTEEEKILAIKGLIDKFLEPAGENFADELACRYRLKKEHALRRKTKNLSVVLGERKFLRSMLSVLNLSGLSYRWNDSDTNSWLEKPEDDAGIEKRIKGLYWFKDDKHRLMIMNITIPAVKKNVDFSILQGTIDDLKQGKQSIIHSSEKYIALGELKGGIDPAGADEHWKTANSALDRIRNGFKKLKLEPRTFFIGAAIENSMASEIYKQLQRGTLDNAANLTDDGQLSAICQWILNL
jgi:hypothetical protein